MASVDPPLAVTIVLASVALMAAPSPGKAAPQYSWQAPDRAARVAALIPGRSLYMAPPDQFLRDWTRAQMARWDKDHPALPAEQAYEAYAKAEPGDAAIAALIPDHISPYGRLLSGKTTKERAEGAMLTFCPLCGQEQAYPSTFAIADPANPYHAQTYCCHQDLYEREQDFPPDYKLRPNSMAEFHHLDGTVAKVPGHTFTDKDGCEWQIFPGTVVAYHRWLTAATQASGFMNSFKDTADPLYAHKLAALLDRVADVYYGLPLSCMNELAAGEDGRPLTRAEWEAWTRPVRAGAVETHERWNRRVPPSSRGWIFMYNELAWVEPFARVRHHPAFKYYSQRKYGDPEALDRKIMTELMRDLALIFESFPLTSDYQDGSYADLMMLGMLLQNPYLFGFAAGHQECVLYNHHYHDAMNGEGAYNYMIMLGGYYAYMADPKGWLDLAPSFLKDNPFFAVASTELEKLHTVRALPLEFGDEHLAAYDGAFQTDAKKVAANELRPSMNWPGHGIGLLRVGGPGHRQEMFMTYDKVSLHGASDKLGIECWVDGVPVMRDGGYAAPWDSAFLDESRPGIRGLLALPYPHKLFESVPRPDKKFECWKWAHGPWAHNTVTVNEQSTGPGWEDNEGLGDLVTYKGGEAPGEPGSRFQVLDCRDLQSWERRGVAVQDFRRILLAVEGPDGRPYAVDILRLRGGQRHALYQHAWGDPVETQLPPLKAQETDLAAYWEKLRGPAAGKLPSPQEYSDLRPVALLGPTPRQWGLTWQTDYAAYAPFDPAGKRTRPIPEDVGRVRLRLIGLAQQGETNLLRAKGPWVATVHQPLPGGGTVDGNVGFQEAFDYLIESRSAPSGETETELKSDYVHVLEGFREGEETAIRHVERLPATGEATALKLALAAGCTDTVLFQPGRGKWQGPDGVSTNARYALVRRGPKGEVTEVNMVRGTRLTAGEFAARMGGDLQGTLVDLIGDLTGTRQESAFVIRPSAPWPIGTGLAGRPVSIQVMNGHRETYTIQKVAPLPKGLLRVDLADHAPFTLGWYQVGRLDEKKPNRLYSNRQLWAGINTPLWWNCKAWFPERGQTFTINKSDADRTTMDLEQGVDLKAAGIQPDDWFTIYAIEPGQAVSVPSELTWHRETEPPGDLEAGAQAQPVCCTVRVTNTATLTMSAESGELWLRVGNGPWQQAKTTFNARERTVTLKLDGNECAGQVVWLRSDKPG